MINVTCAIIIKDNNILVAQRSEKMKMALKWEFPGGKLESGETEIECIIREIKEELNIDIVIVKELQNRIYDHGDYKINLIPFVAHYSSGDIRLTEHKQFRLLKLSELLDLDWAEPDLPIVKELLNLEK